MKVSSCFLLLLIFLLFLNNNIEGFSEYKREPQLLISSNTPEYYQRTNTDIFNNNRVYNQRGYKGNDDMYLVDYEPENCIPFGVPTSYYNKN